VEVLPAWSVISDWLAPRERHDHADAHHGVRAAEYPPAPERKTVVTPVLTASTDTADAPRGDPALVKALARAFRWRRMLEEGRYASIRELAAAEGVDRTYVGRVLNMTLLAPEVVEAMLDGRQSSELSLSDLLQSM
jgi:hypothetical protein